MAALFPVLSRSPRLSKRKKKLLCFHVRDSKRCPNSKSAAYSHKKDTIEKAKRPKEAAQAGKGKGKGKDKSKMGKGSKVQT
jgi:hypothetical protein